MTCVGNRRARRASGAAASVAGGFVRRVANDVRDVYNSALSRLSHGLFSLGKKCLYPVELTAFQADAASARESVVSLEDSYIGQRARFVDQQEDRTLAEYSWFLAGVSRCQAAQLVIQGLKIH